MSKTTAFERVKKSVDNIVIEADKRATSLQKEVDALYERRDALKGEIETATNEGDEDTYINLCLQQRYVEDRIGVLEGSVDKIRDNALITPEQFRQFHHDVITEQRDNISEYRDAMQKAWRVFWENALAWDRSNNSCMYLIDTIHDDVLRDDFDGWRETIPERSKKQRRNYDRLNSPGWNIAKNEVAEVLRKHGLLDCIRG